MRLDDIEARLARIEEHLGITKAVPVDDIVDLNSDSIEAPSATEVANILLDAMDQNGTAWLPLDTARSIVKMHYYKAGPEACAPPDVARMFAVPVTVGDSKIAVVTETVGGKKMTRVVLR